MFDWVLNMLWFSSQRTGFGDLIQRCSQDTPQISNIESVATIVALEVEFGQIG